MTIATARRGRPRIWNNAPQTLYDRLGEARDLVSVTLPKLNFTDFIDIDIEHEAKEAAERVAITRAIRRGRDAWEQIGKAESFASWKDIGAALAIGKAHALCVTGANRAWGQHYSREFNKWLKANGFDRMPKSTRSVAIELHENAGAIDAWRMTLPEKQRRRLIHPLSNVRRWRAATTHGNGKCPQDLRRDAMAAWRRFISCVRLLPPEQSTMLRQTALAELSNV